MATHSSILAWRILWTEEPGGQAPMDINPMDRILWTEDPYSLRGPRIRHD